MESSAGYVVPFFVLPWAMIVLIVALVILHVCSVHNLGEPTQGGNTTYCQSLVNVGKNIMKVFKANTKKFRRKVEVNCALQANLLATTLLCFYFTIYICCLDLYSVSLILKTRVVCQPITLENDTCIELLLFVVSCLL